MLGKGKKQGTKAPLSIPQRLLTSTQIQSF